MKKRLSLTLLILFVLLLPHTGKASEKSTMKTIEQELTMYLNDPQLVPESEAYYTFLMDQLLFGQDKELASKTNYSEIVTYMSGYLNNTILPVTDFYDQTPEELLIHNNSKENGSRENQRSIPTFVNPEAVKVYADRWWNDRNPDFQNWNPNNCANFVSQLILAGGANQTAPEPRPNLDVYETTNYWYSVNAPNNSNHSYEQSTSWIRVIDFFNYWNRSQETISPQNFNAHRDLEIGDVVQLQSTSGGVFYHTMMVIDKDNSTVYLTGNSNDRQRMDIREIKDTNFRAIKFTRKNISDFFPDKNLAQAVALRLNGNPNIDVPVTTEELKNLIDLTATNAGISDLKGLEFAVNLEKLNVDNNSIDTDGMMPLTSLRKLEYLDIRANRILNHKPLGDMAGTALSGPGKIKRINAHNQGFGRSLDATNETDRKLLGLSLSLDGNSLTAQNIVRDKNGSLAFLINSSVAPSILINGTGFTFNWIDSTVGKFKVNGIPENIHTLTIQSSSGQEKIATGFSITITNIDKISSED